MIEPKPDNWKWDLNYLKLPWAKERIRLWSAGKVLTKTSKEFRMIYKRSMITGNGPVFRIEKRDHYWRQSWNYFAESPEWKQK
jgi:hypothetical protein